MCSFYWDYNTSELPDSLHVLCSFAASSNLPIILGGDANAHHTAWGSTNINKRGERLMELILLHNLAIFNDGSMTFHDILRCEALDIAQGNPAALDLVSSRQISNSPSLSDHSLINFIISKRYGSPPATSLPRRRARRINTALRRRPLPRTSSRSTDSIF